ncbi:MAG: SRPBCC domain-containing protein [Candidatus Micrarchaeota archaeon]|nr:SRPBCC domain-containing protein [Candidatus Micrarchaeota archaeon]MDE1805124.1 SRPBCC domain-containing protein [Candidatus Micrarchaeota archaeon]
MEKRIKVRTIRQSVAFDAAPDQVYGLLMDSKKHSEFTGAGAKISKKVGGKFSVFDGWAEGKNLKLAKGRLIVQSWRADDWPEGHYSTVTFKLAKNGKGTKLSFIQTDVPASKYKELKSGWKEYYWDKIKEYFEY